jgi:hypothetical protein
MNLAVDLDKENCRKFIDLLAELGYPVTEVCDFGTGIAVFARSDLQYGRHTIKAEGPSLAVALGSACTMAKMRMVKEKQ